MVNRIGQLVKGKHLKVWSISPDATVYQALELMAAKDIGFLVVMDGNKLMGAFSERDYARKVVLLGKSSKDTHVKEIMSPEVITLSPDNTFEEAMAIMTDKRIRHLPVIVDGKIVGVISMRDVVSAYLGRQKETIQFLEEIALDK
jgi:CBS domain-containing protein